MNILTFSCFGILYTGLVFFYRMFPVWPVALPVFVLFAVVTVMSYAGLAAQLLRHYRPKMPAAAVAAVERISRRAEAPKKRMLPLIPEWMMGCFWVYAAMLAFGSGLFWVGLMALLQVKEVMKWITAKTGQYISKKQAQR